MNILFTGKGAGGSWQCRAVQPGESIGATVKPHATLADMRAHDVIVLVKRPTRELADTLQICGRPFVHDIVDAWKQPEGNDWAEDEAMHWLGCQLDEIRPNAVICATKHMQHDVSRLAGGEIFSTTIYHHARVAYLDDATRKHASYEGEITGAGRKITVGYEGGQNYIERFMREIRLGCAYHGWRFDDKSILRADIALCLRGASGYAPRHWKSNVKLANAQALGIPAICSPESGYAETSTGGVLWVESPQDLRAAFDALSDPQHYARVCAAVDRPPTLAEISKQYLAFLRRVVDRCA